MPKSITELNEQVDLGDLEAVKSSLTNDLSMWFSHYVSYVVCVVFALLYVLLLPVIGLIICCCRRRGNCGGLDDPIEGKYNTCQRRCCAVVLLILCMVILPSVVISLGVTGLMYVQTMETGVTEVIGTNLKQTGEFVDHVVFKTKEVYVNVTEQNLPEIVHEIEGIPQEAQVIVGNTTELTPLLYELEPYLSQLNSTIDHTELLNAGIEELRNSSAELEFSINDLHDNMTTELSSCSLIDPYCNLTLKMIQSLSVVPEYEDLPSLETVINDLHNISSGPNSIFNALAESWSHLFEVSDIVSDTAGPNLNQTLESLHDLQYQLFVFTNLTSATLLKLNFSHTSEVMSSDIAPIVKNAGLITLCLCLTFLILILVIAILGLISLGFGSCGERPLSGPGCCNRGKGSKILVCTNYTLFSSLWLIMLGTTMLFVLGSITHNDMCRHLVDPEYDTEASDTLDEIFASYLNINTSLKETLYNCKENTAIYSALDLPALGKEYNISWILDLDRLGYVDALESLSVLNYSVEHLDILTSDLLHGLTWLDVILQSIDYSLFQLVLSEDITSVDLVEFRDVLIQAAENASVERLADLYLIYADQVS